MCLFSLKAEAIGEDKQLAVSRISEIVKFIEGEGLKNITSLADPVVSQ